MDFIGVLVISLAFVCHQRPGWKICLFLPTRSCDQQQFFRCDVQAKPISRRHATKFKELLAKPSQYLMSFVCYYPFPFL